ncbi:hypothetical protein IWX90DRAFT_992 [Phyllosticta citrichinensis]|uniref:DUF8032 domain-containing protein n=1 Tax=Phyllosticta citrichinensis TaxID=1130410 RepID=A0ABR1Y4U6_9PEZI
MHHPHPAQQGLPAPQPHPRPGVLQQHQQHHPNSPQQPQHPAQHPTTQGPYASPHPPTPHGLPSQQQHQSPYVSNVQVPPGQHPQEVPYYASAHPSPYSTNSTSGSYTSSDLSMATATMNRQFPPIYHTPQSNSPASIQSPQHDQHGRPIYGQSTTQVPQNMYYPPYQMTQQSPYAHQQTAPMAPNMPLMSNQQTQPAMHHPPAHPHTPGLPGSPRTKLNQTPLQRPPSGLGHPQGTPTAPPGSAGSMHSGAPPNSNVNPSAAPGPIPATTPLVVRQDSNGVQWIAFEYSRDRVKMEYTIRCDVESVNVDELPSDFKSENCVYPRACCAKDQYKGNRLHYETECNTVGWALAQLNPCLRGKRGLIQRAVDSWRNSNQDPRLRSRRVRRMAKITNRKAIQQTQPGTHLAGPSAPGAAGIPNPAAAGIAGAPGSRPSNMGMGGGGAQLHHHHEHPGGAPGGDDVSAANDYNEGTHTHHHQAPNGQTGAPAGDVRQGNNFYPTYPPNPAAGNPNIPPLEQTMASVPPPPSHAASTNKQQEDEERNLELFGDLPEAKRRKFILVDDAQRGTRVRVRVMLDQVNMEEMPDSYRKSNSVYPRSYFPTQMQSPPASPRGTRFFDDPEPEEKDDGTSGPIPVTGRTLVPVPMLDGSEAKVPRPRMTRAKRHKEVTLNDLGYRMTWSQSRVFAGRTLFLQRSLDAYRNKMRSTMVAAGQDVAPHFETRVGKRRWLERSKRSKRDASP